MGMIIIFLLGVYAFIATIVILLIQKFLTKNRWIIATLTAIAILIPTYDIVITNILGAYYCYTDPNPKTYIKKKAEYPESIYWEDNVYPGFSAEDRKLMITNYLDGIHLKTMALNGNDGKIYVYHLNKPIWKEIKKEFDSIKYKNIYEQYAQTVIETSEQIYDQKDMPKMNYTVTFDEVELPTVSKKFLYSDETKIIDNNTSEIIAYNRRYMRYFYILLPDFAGGRYYVEDSLCGDWYKMHLKAFNMLEWRLHGFDEHEIDLNKKLYSKFIKGEK